MLKLKVHRFVRHGKHASSTLAMVVMVCDRVRTENNSQVFSIALIGI